VKNIAQCVAQYICVKINAYVTFTVAKVGYIFLQFSLKKLPKVKTHASCENSPNLVTLFRYNAGAAQWPQIIKKAKDV
jgi:hypothetical protein